MPKEPSYRLYLGASLANLFPIEAASAMILLNMTSHSTFVLQSPLMSFVIVMELKNRHETLIPFMDTAFFGLGA